jgi:phage shock protein A
MEARLKMALMALSAGLSIMGSLSAAEGAKEQGKYQAAVARNNAAIADANAAEADKDVTRSFDTAERAGYASQRNAENQDYRAGEAIAETVGDQSVSGLEGGSQTRVLTTLRQLAGIDREALTIQGDAQSEQFRGQARQFELEAADLRSRASVHRSDATMAIAAGNNQARGHYLQAAGPAVSFASDLAMQGLTGVPSSGGGGGGRSSFVGSAFKSSSSKPFARSTSMNFRS